MLSAILRYLVLFFVLMFGIGLIVVAVEYSLRSLTDEKTRKINYQPHPTAIATFIPFVDKQRVRRSVSYSLKTNAMGVRDDGPSCQDANVLLFGDSNIAANFLPFDKTLGEVLESLFDNTICVTNYGVPGYGPDQSLLRMEYEINEHGLTPEVIVLHVFADNDFGDMFRNRLLVIDDGGTLVRTHREDIDFKLRWLERHQTKYLLLRRLYGFLTKLGLYEIGEDDYYPERRGAYISRPYVTTRDSDHFIRYVEAITLDEYQKYKSGKHTTWLGDLYDYWIALNPESEAARVSEELLGTIFLAAKNKSDEIGACLVVLIQPSEWDIAKTGPVSHMDLGRYSDRYQRNYQPRNLTNIAQDAAISSGVSYINLFDIYEVSDENSYVSYKYDGADNHWNEHGVRESAIAIQQFIIGNNCIGALAD